MYTLRFHFALLVISLFLICGAPTLKAQSPLDGFDPNPNSWVRAIAVQSDGKILIGGDFTGLSPNGGAAVTRNSIARLNPDGTLDMTFNPNINPGFGAVVFSIAVQPDGKIIIGGIFHSLTPNGVDVARNNIARLNADGSLDMSFDPNTNSTVFRIALQPDGKVLIGGNFTTLAPNGGAMVTRNNIARLNTDGTLDMSFDPNTNSGVFTIALQPDGKILIGGFFNSLSPNGGVEARRYRRNRVARLNPDGSLDAGFDPNVNRSSPINTRDVYAIAVQADGKILIGGLFSSLAPNGGAEVVRNCIARVNPDGSLDTAFNPNVTGISGNSSVTTIAVQPDGKIIIGGAFTTLTPNGGASVTRSQIARLNIDGTADAAFNPNPDNVVRAVAVQPDGKILIGGLFNSLSPNNGASVARKYIARLERDGRADQTLNLNMISGSSVSATAIQPDGKIIIGGSFASVLGTQRKSIARLNTDGTLDTIFNPNVAGDIYTIAVQADGKILIGGFFNSLAPNGGASFNRYNIARLNPDGTVDVNFNPNADMGIYTIAVQPDGKILVGGRFAWFTPNGGAMVPRIRIARLNIDGTVDMTFNANVNSLDVSSIAVQPDGKIIIGGAFTSLTPNGGASVTRNHIARVNADGTLDATFDPNAGGGSFISVVAITLQPDGKILIGGNFTTLAPNGGATVTRNRIARLNTDGTVDAAFDPNVNGGNFVSVVSIAAQSDGKILVGGDFSSLAPNGGAAITRNNVARLNTDGAVDATFNPNVSSAVYSIAMQSDGKILLGGGFTSLAPNGGVAVPRNCIARLSNDTAALSSLTVTRTAVTLTRDGAAPLFTRVVFELSVDNGANYTSLGTATNSFTSPVESAAADESVEGKSGVRLAPVPLLAPQAAGYTLGGLNLPSGQNILIRARGFYRMGVGNGSETIEDKVQNVFLPAQ